MKQYWVYLKYLMRHKYYVSVECFKHGLFWRGLTHDLSKFGLTEFSAYANYFYNPDGSKRIGSKHSDISTPFNLAWLHHQNKNDHHWQWWILQADDGLCQCMPMSKNATMEMLCDWIGAGKAQGFSDNLIPWYLKNAKRIEMHRETRIAVHKFLIVASDNNVELYQTLCNLDSEIYYNGK